MRGTSRVGVALAAMLLAGLWAATPARAADEVKQLRLYALDCGHATFPDMGMFSDTGEYDGKPGAVADPCFVIRHPKGTLLWDAGLGDKVAQSKTGVDNGPIHLSQEQTLVDQLKAIGLIPGDVGYLAFSHFHFDHTGNANLFTSATWIINKNELAWALSTPTPFGVDPSTIAEYKNVKTKMIDGDEDVFGDGSVRILKTPGHTPGHQVLLIKLKKSGSVILSGDLYHIRENRQHARVPGFNYSRADTLASINRIETIARNTKARMIVQHDERDSKALPKAPKYLD